MDRSHTSFLSQTDKTLHQKVSDAFLLSVTAHCHICDISFIQNHKKSTVSQNFLFFFHNQKHGIVSGQKSEKSLFCPRNMKKILFDLHYLIQVIHKHFSQDHTVAPSCFCAFSLSARSLSAWETRRYSGTCSAAVSVRPSLQ